MLPFISFGIQQYLKSVLVDGPSHLSLPNMGTDVLKYILETNQECKKYFSGLNKIIYSLKNLFKTHSTDGKL